MITHTKIGVSLLIAFGLLASSATAGGRDLNPKNEPRAAPKGVHTDASGVSGWAVVAADGTLVRKLNGKAVTKLNVGTYEVAFSSIITKCAYTGQIAETGSSGAFSNAPGITVVGRSGNAKALFVQTFDSSNVAADEPFHIVVSC